METKIKSRRKANVYVVNEALGICTILTKLSKSINENKKLWQLDSYDNLKLHEYEAIIDNDDKLISYLKENFLVFYDNTNDTRHAKRDNPTDTPFDNVGYFFCWHIHTHERIPLGRLVWEFKTKQKIPQGFVVDHGNDYHNLNIKSNLNFLSQQQNKNKLRFPKRINEQYSATLISSPFGTPEKLIRFMDTKEQYQELLIYDTTQGIENILADLNSFKAIEDDTPDKFKQHFEDLKNNSKSYIGYSKQSIRTEPFEQELFHISIDWTELEKQVEKLNTIACAG